MELFRYEDIKYAPPLDEFENPIGEGRVAIRLYKFPVLKETPQGVWIDTGLEKKWINLSARKKYACLTEEEAKESFIARKKRQIRILESQLNRAHSALSLAKNEL